MKAQTAETHHPVSPFFQFDSYYSFIGYRSADVWGFKAGVSWNKKWRFGIGYNKIKADIVEKKLLPESEWSNSDATDHFEKAQLYLRYYPLAAEYVLYSDDPWQITLPLSIGYGKSYFQYYDKNEKPRSIFKHGVLIHDIGINVNYKIIKWVGVGAGIGYRLMLINNPEIATKFNSPIFSFRIKIYVGEILKSAFPNDEFIKDHIK